MFSESVCLPGLEFILQPSASYVDSSTVSFSKRTLGKQLARLEQADWLDQDPDNWSKWERSVLTMREKRILVPVVVYWNDM